MPETNEHIELRSDDVQEIMSHVPNWMIRWGITLIFGLIALFIFISWFIQYPDTINGSISISTKKPLIRIVCKSSGELIDLAFKDGESVTSESTIARIKNNFSIEAKNYLELLCDEIKSPKDIMLINFSDEKIVFGSLQTEYSELKSLILEYQSFVKNNSTNIRIHAIREQIENYSILRSICYQQLSTAKKELENAKKKYASDEELYAKKVISKVQLYEEEKKLIQTENNLGNYKKESVQNSITITNLEQELKGLVQDKKKQESDFINKINISVSNIRNSLMTWGEEYKITAPFDGTLAYLESLNEFQFIEAGKPLFAVVPINQDFIGYIDVPKSGYGKIKIGQKVQIEIDKYPSYEFGRLEGTVSSIALLAKESVYRIGFKLKNGMTSSYNRKFEYTPEMTGNADIITDDVRLLTRIFNKFRKVLDK